MKTILIIEDNRTDQFVAKSMFARTDPEIEILIAFDGQEAIEILKKEDKDPDLILLDINMPRMNGHDFLETFTEGNKREIPVIVMLTSSDQEEDKEKAFQYKCVQDYFIKPLTIQKIEALKKALKD